MELSNFDQVILDIIENQDGMDVKFIVNDVNPQLCKKIIIASFISKKQVITAMQKISFYAKANDEYIGNHNRKRNIDAEWIAIDCGETVVHLFNEGVREYYQMDKFYYEAE